MGTRLFLQVEWRYYVGEYGKIPMFQMNELECFVCTFSVTIPTVQVVYTASTQHLQPKFTKYAMMKPRPKNSYQQAKKKNQSELYYKKIYCKFYL